LSGQAIDAPSDLAGSCFVCATPLESANELPCRYAHALNPEEAGLQTHPPLKGDGDDAPFAAWLAAMQGRQQRIGREI